MFSKKLVTKTIREDRNACRWIKSYISREAAIQALEALVLGLFGIVVIVVTSYLVMFFILFVFFRADTLYFFAGANRNPLALPCIIGLFLFILALSFAGAYKNRWGVDFGSSKPGWLSPVSLNLFSGMAKVICECLYSGPRLMFASFESLLKSLRLTQMDCDQISLILLWLYKKGEKGKVTEIAEVFPQLNTVRIIPQLRDIPGIIWLPSDDATIIMQKNLRILFGAAMQERGFVASGISYRQPKSDDAGEHRNITAKILEWYKQLGLQPFDSLQNVKRRYRELVKIYHPDLRGGKMGFQPGSYDEKIRLLNDAYRNILTLTSSNTEVKK